MKYILTFLILFLGLQANAVDAWYDNAWLKRIKVTVNGDLINGTLSNFPVYVNLNGMPASFTNDCKNNGADLRVTKNDGTTEIAREIVFLNRTSNAGELHFVANGTLSLNTDRYFYIYYKNTAASEPAVNATYGKNNVWTGYTGVWHFQENPAGSAPQLIDSAGIHHGTAGGSMTASQKVAGKIGNGWSMDGTNDFISIMGNGQDFGINGSQLSFTVSLFYSKAWVNNVSRGDHSWDATADDGSFRGPYGGPQAGVSNDRTTFGNSGDRLTSSAVDMSGLNVFYGVDYIQNGLPASTKGSIFVDGSLDRNDVTFSTTVYGKQNNKLSFGSSTFISGDRQSYMQGVLDEFRFSRGEKNKAWLVTQNRNLATPKTFVQVGATENGGGAVSSPWGIFSNVF